ncbi:MAG: hypothetical protein RLY43_148, partial [Bacteroidota bacterium]
TPGVYYATAQAEISGITETCKVAVGVGEQYWNEPLDEMAEEEFIDEYYTDEDGNKYLLDPNSPPGKITFNMEKTLTNTTCVADWNAEYVLKCGMYRNNVKVKDIGFNESENLAPGSYQIKCIQKRDGKEISSEIRTCRLNPDTREL